MKIFNDEPLREILEGRAGYIKGAIEREDEDYILKVNEDQYIEHMTSELIIDTPVIDTESKYITYYEKDLPRVYDKWFDEYVYPGKKQVIIYHLPFTGNQQFLSYVPDPHILWTTEVEVSSNEITFEIINHNNNQDQIKRSSEDIIASIQTQLGYVTKQIEVFNGELKHKVAEAFQHRKSEILSRRALVQSLGVPIKVKENIPQTYSIPNPATRKKIVIPKPSVVSGKFEPEPALSESVYHEILQTIFDTGKVFERLPSTHHQRTETDLRDQILLYLQPRFEGSATGETFNNKGKTDILLRYQNSNVFVGECKIWKGEKELLGAMDQLLGYLTWRDSKAALIVFVRNKDFTNIIKTVEATIPTHPNFLKFVNNQYETWLNYRIHINGDTGREVHLAVLLFHIPNID